MAKFKVGDKVEIVNGLYKGDVGVITKVDGSNVPYLVETAKREVWCISEHLRLVESKPATRYKVGDYVRVKSREWYEANKDKDRRICFGGGRPAFAPTMSGLCGRRFRVKYLTNQGYYLLDEPHGWIFCDEMLEDAGSERYNVTCDSFRQAAELPRAHFHPKEQTPANNTPLIRTTKLLTNIKLD